MTNINRLAALARAAAALAVSAPAAAQVATASSNGNPTARAQIVKPLVLTSTRNLDFGTIVYDTLGSNAVVAVNQAGTVTCPAPLTCSGSTASAGFNVRGTNNQRVTITAVATDLTNANDSSKLRFTPDSPANVTLTSSGAPGNNFSVGGSITLTPTTTDGLYSGQVEVTVNY